MEISVHETPIQMGQAAAALGARLIEAAIAERGQANIVVATGASQFEVLSHLVTKENVSWDKVHGFHLDEYIGVDDQHPASFRRYLRERFVEQAKPSLASFEYISPDDFPDNECSRLGSIIKNFPIDVAFIGIGENGHLAFNDPPADFETETPYLVVDLDDACRQQQLGEGWFPTFDDVPAQAISMSIKQIAKSSNIICSVPDQRKAEAVRAAVKGPLTPHCPASYLQTHSQTHLFLDRASASLLET